MTRDQLDRLMHLEAELDQILKSVKDLDQAQRRLIEDVRSGGIDVSTFKARSRANVIARNELAERYEAAVSAADEM